MRLQCSCRLSGSMLGGFGRRAPLLLGGARFAAAFCFLELGPFIPFERLAGLFCFGFHVVCLQVLAHALVVMMRGSVAALTFHVLGLARAGVLAALILRARVGVARRLRRLRLRLRLAAGVSVHGFSSRL